MRHVTDGELHAFLDGALDILPHNRGEEIRDHISSCSVCAERLQDEEALRSHAGLVLGPPDLGEVVLPTFEELRERAEAPGSKPLLPTMEAGAGARYRGPVKGLPLAWAATIVLALGVGWMGAQVGRTLPGGGRPGGSLREVIPQDAPSSSPTDFDTEGTPAEEVQTSRPELGAPSVESRPIEVSEGTPGSAPPELRTLERRGQTAADLAGSPGEISEPLTVEIRSDLAELAVGEGDRTTDSLILALTGSMVDSLAPRRSAEGASKVTAGRLEPLGIVPESLENSLAFRGLKVVSIEWEERVPGEKALLIRQLLSQGDTLELRYLGMLLGADPDPQGLREGRIPVEDSSTGRVYANVLEASLPPGWHQVVMERGRGLLVARGPVSEENLKALLKTLY